jgi:hypothetical protein
MKKGDDDLISFFLFPNLLPYRQYVRFWFAKAPIPLGFDPFPFSN